MPPAQQHRKKGMSVAGQAGEAERGSVWEGMPRGAPLHRSDCTASGKVAELATRRTAHSAERLRRPRQQMRGVQGSCRSPEDHFGGRH